MAFVTVEGEVSRLNRTGDGFGVKESWKKRDGGEGSRYWSVFPESPLGVRVGDRVKVSGGLTTSVTDPKPDNDRRYVDHTVNNARLVGDTSRQVSPSVANSAPVVANSATTDAWSTPAVPSVADQWAGNTITPVDATATPF